jgi:beta-xylosidase
MVQAGKGLIDPCPLWDDDGKAYLVHAYAHSRSGMKHKLRVVPMLPDGARLLGEGQIVFHEPDRHHTIEGPKFLKRDGWYYILAPAGGVTTGWQTALRSRNIFGQYEDRIVLEQGRTKINGPHQGALVDTANGEWWFLHFQDTGVYGRVVHLQPVRWKDGWPLIGADGPNKIGEPVLEYPKPALPAAQPEAQPASDEFTSSRLGLQWQWNANHQDAWHSLTARPGWLRLFSQTVLDENLAQAPHLLLQKFPARKFAVETRLEFTSTAKSAEAGLVVMGHEYAAIAIAQSRDDRHIIYRQNGKTTRLKALQKSPARFRVKVQDGGVCEFAYACNDDDFITVTSLFQARAGAWVGARVGIYSSCTSLVNEHADFDYFRFLPQTSKSQR